MVAPRPAARRREGRPRAGRTARGGHWIPDQIAASVVAAPVLGRDRAAGAEAGEAALPAGPGQRRLVAVGEGVGEHQDASPAVGAQLEAERPVALPAADQQVGRFAVADFELAGEPAAELVGFGQGAPDPFDGLVVAPFETQRRAFLEARPAKAEGRDERPARGGVESEAGRVAFVPLPDWLVGALFRQGLAGPLRGETIP